MTALSAYLNLMGFFNYYNGKLSMTYTNVAGFKISVS